MILENLIEVQYASSKDQHFLFQRIKTNRPERVKVTPKIISLLPKPLTERLTNLLRKVLKFTPIPKPNTIGLSEIQEVAITYVFPL